jgi:hypothetical protein
MAIVNYFLAPAALLYWVTRRGSPAHHPAIAVCAGALVFAFFQFVLLPAARKQNVKASHLPRNN